MPFAGSVKRELCIKWFDAGVLFDKSFPKSPENSVKTTPCPKLWMNAEWKTKPRNIGKVKEIS